MLCCVVLCCCVVVLYYSDGRSLVLVYCKATQSYATVMQSYVKCVYGDYINDKDDDDDDDECDYS